MNVSGVPHLSAEDLKSATEPVSPSSTNADTPARISHTPPPQLSVFDPTCGIELESDLQCSKGKGLYKRVSGGFRKAVEGDKILTKQFAEAAQTIAPVYATIFGEGTLCNNLKKDLESTSKNSFAAFLNFPNERKYVNGLITHEMNLRGKDTVRSDKTSGIRNVLWMNRALTFIIRFLEETVMEENYDETPKDIAFRVYGSTLRNYHGFLVMNIVLAAFRALPSKDLLIQKLGFGDIATARTKVQELTAIAKPILENVNSMLEAADCNFPDKA